MNKEWIATYRLQVHSGFPLSAAEAELPWLAKLGISHVYLSPCLQAVPGSTHGYDVADPGLISKDLGGEEAWSHFHRAARAHGLEILLDIVPNHMAADTSNPWWDDVLANGPYSPWCSYFDLFTSGGQEPWRLHLARLARPCEAALAGRDFRIELSRGLPRVFCGENSWPLTAMTWAGVIRDLDLEGEITSELRALAAVSKPDAVQMDRWHLLSVALRDRIRSDAVCAALSAEEMQELLLAQFYQLHFWKREPEVINYRRFFAVGTLVGVRVEDSEVFTASHGRVAQMIANGEIAGLRVDHPDGLYDPASYLRRLRALMPDGRIYVEKILADGEELSEEWPVDGTVGYEALRVLNSVMVEPRGASALTAFHADFCGEKQEFLIVAREMKRMISRTLFPSEFARLASLAVKLAGRDSITQQQMAEAILELTACLPVYRTYRAGDALDSAGREALRVAFASAREREPAIFPDALSFLETLLFKPSLTSGERACVARWQQLSGSVMAKGVEDTAYYRWHPLPGANEVGGNPAAPSLSLEAFHAFWQGRSRPGSLIPLSTHDTKRSGDVRARLAVLSCAPQRWRDALLTWSEMNLDAWRDRPPDKSFEWLFYQTLTGAWPLDRERCFACMEKSCREAAVHTSWDDPNEPYEASIRSYINAVYDRPEFVSSLEKFVGEITPAAAVTSLAQTLIQLTAPGIPDIYQGTEMWDYSLVDPDNRRPVDFSLRRDVLDQLPDLTPSPEAWCVPSTKLWLIHRTLQVRRSHPRFFGGSSPYRPLFVEGSQASRLIAFTRGEENVAVVVPRFTFGKPAWEDTRIPLPGGLWVDQFSGLTLRDAVDPSQLFAQFPVALLLNSSRS
ncbi:MAG TPA: malto-oligosyltrehalose synthase [Verrucomicrobiales bacterium]|nr:malto-oligosyltrehalose synthase [Verrucomicrobiales bacterium]